MTNLEFFSFIHPVLIYVVIFFGLVVEGELTLLAAGLLVYFGLLDYFFVFAAAFFGSWLGDMIWYAAGEKWGSPYFAKHKRWLFLTKKRWLLLEKHFQEGNSSRTIFFSKFSYGINHAVIVVAGASRMNFRKFTKVDGWATLIWVAVVLSVIQLLGQSFDYLRQWTKDIGTAIAVVVVIMVAIEILVAKKASKRL